MRISDWSSDVCSSDLSRLGRETEAPIGTRDPVTQFGTAFLVGLDAAASDKARRAAGTGEDQETRLRRVERLVQKLACFAFAIEIGRASCRERGCQYV